MKKRKTTVIWLRVFILVCLFGFSSAHAGAQQFTWKKYKGTEINILSTKNPWSRFMAEEISKFEQLTGMKANYEHLVVEQYRQKILVGLVAGDSTIDVFNCIPVMNGTRYWLNGWLEPLDIYLADAALTNPEYDFQDFIPASIKVVRRADKLIGVPLFWVNEILMYNTEIFQKYGVKVPRTLDELEKVAAKLTRPEENLYGFTSRGMGGGVAVPPFAPFLFSMGGGWTDEEGNAALNSPQAIAAFEFYGKLMREYNPPGPLNFNWRQAQDAFISSRAAQWVGMSLFAANVENPELSRIVGKAGYSVFPAGPAGSKPQWDGWCINISSFSRNKEAAWYFIQWATGKEECLAAHLGGVPSPRISSWEAEEFKQGWRAKHPELVEVQLKSAEIMGYEEFPPVVNVQKAREIITGPIVAAIRGGDVKSAADKANKALQRLIDETKVMMERIKKG